MLPPKLQLRFLRYQHHHNGKMERNKTSTLLHHTFLAFNITVLLCAITSLGLGTYLNNSKYWQFRAHENYDISIPIYVHSSHRCHASKAFFGVGAVLLGLAAVGLMVPWVRIHRRLLVHIFYLLLVCGIMAGAVFIYYYGEMHARQSDVYLKNSMYESLSRMTDRCQIRRWFDLVHGQHHCCGVEGFTDFRLTPWYRSSGPVSALERNTLRKPCVLTSCCKIQPERVIQAITGQITINRERYLFSLMQESTQYELFCTNLTLAGQEACLKNDLRDSYLALNHMGCLSPLKERFHHEFAEPHYMIDFAIAIFIFMLVGILLNVVVFVVDIRSMKKHRKNVSDAKAALVQENLPGKF